MRLYYHLAPQGNVGDDLNPWLWGRLLPGVFDGHCYHDPCHRRPGDTGQSLFVGIGTLLNRVVPASPLKAVFGTGAGYGDTPTLDERWTVYCVRGPLTAAALGLPADAAVTDAAALCATLDLNRGPTRHRYAFMPHCSTAVDATWDEVCADLDVHYIDPRWPPERVFDSLLATELLVTEAMHGAILADTLRVPWISVSTSPIILDFKWRDWCLSLGLAYRKQTLPALWRPQGQPAPMRQAARYAKVQVAKMGLRRVFRTSRPQLSDERRLADAVEELGLRLERFKADHRQGRFDV